MCEHTDFEAALTQGQLEGTAAECGCVKTSFIYFH